MSQETPEKNQKKHQTKHQKNTKKFEIHTFFKKSPFSPTFSHSQPLFFKIASTSTTFHEFPQSSIPPFTLGKTKHSTAHMYKIAASIASPVFVFSLISPTVHAVYAQSSHGNCTTDDPYYPDEVICYSCELGWSGDECDIPLCHPGYHSEDGSQPCEQCPFGFYQNDFGSTDCVPCSIGSYTDQLAASSCQNCTAGYYSDVEGSSRCIGWFWLHVGWFRLV